jgi:cytosine/adenosine deaminase-related metal-dependent hydrolase
VSLWPEIQVLAKNFPGISPKVWLAAATTGGAQALHLPHLGGLASGLRPGIIDVSLDAPLSPLESLVASPDPRVRWRAPA